MKKVINLFAFSILILATHINAQVMPIKHKMEQSEDFNFYKAYHWDSEVTRKALYTALSNGQNHMMEKMRTCQDAAIEDLESWLDAFKRGGEEVTLAEENQGIRDMDGNEIRDPENGDYVARWITRDYAEKHSHSYTVRNLRQLQDGFWSYCIKELPVKLFTKEAQQRLEEKARRDPVYR